MFRCRLINWVWAAAILFSAHPYSLCQADLQNQLNSAYKDKVFLLRNFYSGKVLTYSSDGTLLGTTRSDSWTLASFKIDRITARALGIEIVGNRLGTSYYNGKRGLEKIGKLTIDVAIPDISKTTSKDVDSIFNKIFIQPGENVLSMLPDYWECATIETSSTTSSNACKDTMEKSSAIVFKPNQPGAKVKAPRAIYSPDPDYTKEARALHQEGVSVLWLVIDDTGTPRTIRIVRPLGMGLDEQAVQAVSGWKFEPAKKDGQPVAVQINVEVEFKSYP